MSGKNNLLRNTMSDLNMGNVVYALNNDEVRRQVKSNQKGNYAFGIVKEDGLFYVYYVGRSDEDLQTEIIARSANYPQLTHFMYSYASSKKEAFEKECKNYHDFKCPALLNKIHPDRPDGADYHCPVCGHPVTNYLNFFRP